MKKMTAARSMVMRVEPRPRLRVEWSLTAPMMRGEMASPRAWMMKSWPAMAVARISGRTALRVAALTGPVPRKMRKMAAPRPWGGGEGVRAEETEESGWNCDGGTDGGDEVEGFGVGAGPLLRNGAAGDGAAEAGYYCDSSHDVGG